MIRQLAVVYPPKNNTNEQSLTFSDKLTLGESPSSFLLVFINMDCYLHTDAGVHTLCFPLFMESCRSIMPIHTSPTGSPAQVLFGKPAPALLNRTPDPLSNSKTNLIPYPTQPDLYGIETMKNKTYIQILNRLHTESEQRAIPI